MDEKDGRGAGARSDRRTPRVPPRPPKGVEGEDIVAPRRTGGRLRRLTPFALGRVPRDA